MKKIYFYLFFVFFCNNLFAESFVKTCVKSECNFEKADNSCNKDIFGKTFFSFRPDDSNTARRILGIYNKSVDFSLNDLCLSASIALQWQRSFSEKDFSKWFMFKCSNCMSVGVPNEHEFDIDATQFGLGLFNNEGELISGPIGKFCIKPKIEKFIADFDFRFNLDNLLCGLWSRISFPIVHQKTDLRISQNLESSNLSGIFAPGLFNLDCEAVNSVYNSIIDALNGDVAFGDFPELKYGKFPRKSLSKTRVASVAFDLGYDIYKDNCGHFSPSIHLVVPTGNRPKSKFLFEPVIGANKSWQLGIAIDGSYIFYNEDINKFGLYYYAVLTHLFKAHQTRLFSLRSNGDGSQYLLLKKFSPAGSTEIEKGERAANILAGDAKIGASIMLDASLMFHYSHCNIFADLGYNLWYRSKEKLNKTVCFRDFAESAYGIKGDSLMSEEQFMACNIPPVCNDFPVTESTSTISKPGPFDQIVTPLPNPPGHSVEGDPIYITADDINFNTPLHPSSVSNKIFGSIGYNWQYCEYPGYILFGGEIEFGSNNKALNQWGIILKAGLAF